MSKTVLSDEVRKQIRGWAINSGAPIERVTDYVEQAVLQSPEIRQLRKDAERYQWLRNDCLNDAFGHDVLAPVVFNTDDSFNHSDDALMGDDLDQAIDAAMEAKP